MGKYTNLETIERELEQMRRKEVFYNPISGKMTLDPIGEPLRMLHHAVWEENGKLHSGYFTEDENGEYKPCDKNGKLLPCPKDYFHNNQKQNIMGLQDLDLNAVEQAINQTQTGEYNTPDIYYVPDGPNGGNLTTDPSGGVNTTKMIKDGYALLRRK
ncbi:MAG: hypothetical protein J5873_01000 [Bacteroidales bacterium]|nr:hypothetical protein [Bacteroidales bacterium]